MKGVSVIIPTFNREHLLREAIASAVEQVFEGELEIIVSDDGSTDRTVQVAKSFGKKVKIVEKPKNCLTQGAAGARNRGILASTMPLVSFLDSDDFYLNGHVRKMAKLFDNNDSLGFAFCRMLEVREIGGRTLFRPWTHKKVLKNDIKNPVISRSNIIHTNSLMFKREVFDKVGLFNTNYSQGEDGDMWMRISEQFKGEFSDHYGAVYRIFHENAQLTKASLDEINKCHLKIHQKAIQRYYELQLVDPNRIFELQHLSLHGNKHNGKIRYALLYLKLILSHPITFLKRIPVYYYELLEKKEHCKWYTLNELTNSEKHF